MFNVLILTSPNSNTEIDTYWGNEYEHYGVFKTFQNDDFKNDDDDFDDNKIAERVSEGGIVFIHHAETKIEDITVGNKRFIKFGYSTTRNDEFYNLLWSWNGSSKWAPPSEVSLPFDKLNLALRINDEVERNSKVEEARKAIIKWVEEKKQSVDKLEVALNFLHACLPVTSKDSAKALIIPIQESSSINRSFEEWQKEPNENKLIALRDEVLIWAGVS